MVVHQSKHQPEQHPFSKLASLNQIFCWFNCANTTRTLPSAISRTSSTEQLNKSRTSPHLTESDHPKPILSQLRRRLVHKAPISSLRGRHRETYSNRPSPSTSRASKGAEKQEQRRKFYWNEEKVSEVSSNQPVHYQKLLPQRTPSSIFLPSQETGIAGPLSKLHFTITSACFHAAHRPPQSIQTLLRLVPNPRTNRTALADQNHHHLGVQASITTTHPSKTIQFHPQ